MWRLLILIAFVLVLPADATEVLFDKELTVPRGDFKEVHYLISGQEKKFLLEGQFTCRGGFYDDVIFYVFTKDQFVRWLSGHSSKPLIKFDKKKEGKFSVPANGEETYYFVFDNFFSTISHKQVKLHVKLIESEKNHEGAKAQR